MIKQKLHQAGLRLTSQRLKIAEILFLGSPKHFTAEHVYKIIKKQNLNISLATIYNTLRDFSRKKLINEINFDPGKNWYDTRLDDHHHFYNKKTQKLIDIKKSEISLKEMPNPPKGCKINKYDVIIEIE